MADAKRKMMGRTFGQPAFEKRHRVGFEKAACVGVARRRDGALYRLAFGNDELEFSPNLTGISFRSTI